MGLRAAALLLLLAPQASPAAAQAAAEITLIIQQGGKEIGRESFTLTQGRGRGAPGSTLSATARYPATVRTTSRAPEPAARITVDPLGLSTSS